ncbi:MAG TPA: hypothetical protein DCM05_15940 [Elusimicrobia bacterium]|nr:hypothetical protein [Elusimicrobiota bacterium]
MPTLRTFAALLLALAAAQPAAAMEVSLEENRAERGSIGYVDIQRVFQRFPQTHKAKQSFQEIVRQAEDQVNLRRAEILALRSEISKQQVELDLLKNAPLPVQVPAVEASTAPAPAPVEVSSAAPSVSPSAAPALPEISTETATLPAEPAVDASSSAVVPDLPGMKPLTINLPGLTTAPMVVEPPQETAAVPSVSTAAAAAAEAAVARAEEERLAAEQAQRQARERAQAAELAAATARAREARLKELQDSLELKRKQLAAKEEEFQKHQSQVERNLLELENRRSEILLGKIYTVIQEVARENGVGVVVDKNQILFGQNSVDLTEKVIKKLEGL